MFFRVLYPKTKNEGGERTNKKILGVFVTILAVAMLATPVMAAPAEKIPITLTLTTAQMGTPEKTKLTNGNISFQIGIKRNFTVVVTGIPGADPLEGDYYTNRKTTVNRKTSTLLVFADGVLVFPGGTFEGRFKSHVTDFSYPPPTGDTVMHCVMHGTGAFKGQTLKLSHEGSVPLVNKLINGVLIRPHG